MVVKWCRGLMGRDNPPCFDEPTTRGSSQDLYTSVSYTSASQDLYTSASLGLLSEESAGAKENSGGKSPEGQRRMYTEASAPDVHGQPIGANVRTHCELCMLACTIKGRHPT